MYSRKGVAEVGFTSQKHTINLCILRAHVTNAHRAPLKGVSVGKGANR